MKRLSWRIFLIYMAFVYLFVFILYAVSCADKPAVLSAPPLPIPAETLQKGVWQSGEFGPLPLREESDVPRTQDGVARLYGASTEVLDEPDWRGMVILPDLTAVRVDPEFAAAVSSVTWQESRWNCGDSHLVTVGNQSFWVIGLFQLLWDPALARRAARLGFTVNEMQHCLPNTIVAESWWLDTHSWERWDVKPQYRTDSWVSEGGF